MAAEARSLIVAISAVSRVRVPAVDSVVALIRPGIGLIIVNRMKNA